MNQYGLAFLGLTALVAFLVVLLTFAFLRFGAAVKQSRGNLRHSGTGATCAACAGP